MGWQWCCCHRVDRGQSVGVVQIEEVCGGLGCAGVLWCVTCFLPRGVWQSVTPSASLASSSTSGEPNAACAAAIEGWPSPWEAERSPRSIRIEP